MSFIDVVVPIFGFMLIGWLLKAAGFFPEWLVRLVNGYVYYIGMAVITFLGLYDTEKRLLLDPSIYALILIPIALIVLLALATAHLLKIGKLSIPVFVICAFFGNTAYIGFPLNAGVQGNQSLGLTAFVSAIYTIVVFTLGAFLLRHYVRDQTADRLKPKAGSDGLKVIIDLFKIPIIWATVLGLALSFIALPAMVRLPLEWISTSTSPLALLATGAMISGSGFREYLKPLGALSLIKLVVMPAIVILMAFAMGISGTIYRTSLLEAATPVGVSNAVLAEHYKADRKLASSAVVLSTLLFFVSLIVVLLFV